MLKYLPAVLLVLGTTACDRIDPELVADIHDRIEAVESAMNAMEEEGQRIGMLAAQMEQAPVALKSDTASNFVVLNDKMGALQDGFYQRGEQISSLLTRLRALSDQYGAGKIGAEAAKKEYDTLNLEFQRLDEAGEKARQDFDQVSAGYGRMMADFKAKAEME